MNLFGWTLRGKAKEVNNVSFSPPVSDDGAVVVASGSVSGMALDLLGTARTEADLITRYREMIDHPEVNSAVDDVVNEAIVLDEDFIVRLDLEGLDELGVSEKTKQKIEMEFENILDLFDFGDNAYETFKRWYVDGRLNYHVIIDEKNQGNGIIELRYLDPRKIRKVREVEEIRMENGVSVSRVKEEYYLYNEIGLTSPAGPAPVFNSASGIKILPDSILQVTSGITDKNNNLVLSHLHQGIKPLNQLRIIEDAIVIYRVSRSPEKRIFYIDVGNLPKMAAENYVRDVMTRHKNRLIYDAATGEIRDDRKYMTMMEDYWFARREGGKGTQVETLPSGQNLGELADLEWFQKKLYRSLQVPLSRLDPETGMTLGRASEISRDEVKFSKFVSRVRRRFNQLFLKAMEKQLVMKKIIADEEWDMIRRRIRFEYVQDNHFAELKNNEIMLSRAALAQQLEPYIGRYISNFTMRKDVFMQDEEDMQKEDSRIAQEAMNPQFLSPEMKMAAMQADQAQENMAVQSEIERTTPEPKKKN
jgi:hypothetical protein